MSNQAGVRSSRSLENENQTLRQENRILVDAAADHDREMAELSESEEHFRVLVEQVQDYAIFGMDPNGIINSWNLGGERIKGYKSEEILGHHLSQLYLPEDRAAGAPEKHLQAAREHGTFKGEGWRLRKDGTQFWAEIVLTSLHRRDGSLRGFSKVTRDMTQRRLHDQEMEVRTKELERANEALEQFAYAAAHDLKEPIRNISLYTQRLARFFPDPVPEVSELFHYVTDGSKRLQALVRDLFEYVQAIEEPDQAIEATNTHEVLEEVLFHLQHSRDETGAHIDVGPLPTIRIYRAHCLLLFQNLVSNAIKYRSSNTPEIRIWAEQKGDWWQFSVRDNGIGIQPEHRERIFEVFKRLHGREIPGTGIGLAICCRIVSHYGGRIWVEPVPSGGSTFHFLLPAEELVSR